MKLNKGLASYPILISGDDDYIDSHFDAEVKQNIEFGKIKIGVDFITDNQGLKKLIEENKASYVVHFECSLLGYRKFLMTTNENNDYYIDLNEVDSKVEVSTFIIATQDIKKYYNNKFNWEYGQDGIDIDKGNILAIGPTYTIDVNHGKEGFKKISDIISIKQDSNIEKGEYSVALEGDVIIIYVNENIKNQYYIHGKKYLYNIISMIMVPSMIYILNYMKNNKEGLEEYRWFKIIEKLLKENGVEVEQLRNDESSGKYSIFELAQKIFKYPLEKGIIELNREWGEDKHV